VDDGWWRRWFPQKRTTRHALHSKRKEKKKLKTSLFVTTHTTPPWAKQSLSHSNWPPPLSPSTEGSSTTSVARVATLPIFYPPRPLHLKKAPSRLTSYPPPPPRGTLTTTQQTSPSAPPHGPYPTFPNLHSSINMHVYTCIHSPQPFICTINHIIVNYRTSKTSSITLPTWPFRGQVFPYHSLFGINY